MGVGAGRHVRCSRRRQRWRRRHAPRPVARLIDGARAGGGAVLGRGGAAPRGRDRERTGRGTGAAREDALGERVPDHRMKSLRGRAGQFCSLLRGRGGGRCPLFPSRSHTDTRERVSPTLTGSPTPRASCASTRFRPCGSWGPPITTARRFRR